MANQVTVSSLKKDYQDYLQAQNSQINPYGVNSFWDIDAGAMALIFLDLYMNLSLVRNSIFAQNSVGTQVDQWLFDLGLPARGGLTYGTITGTVTATTSTSLPINTIFNDTPALNPSSFTNNQYQNLVAYPSGIIVGSVLTLYALNPGSNYIEPIGNSLVAQIGANSVTIEVNFSINGQQQESDESCINRVLQVLREPRAGARSTDYAIYARAANSQVTDSIILPNYLTINDINILGVFVLVGTFITEYQLNQGLLPATTFTAYAREADLSTISTVNNYIQGLKLVALPAFVSTSLTKYVFTDSSELNIEVALPAGYNLSTIISIESQNADLQPVTIQLSVEDLVKKEARRAICNQPYGGTKIGGNLYVTMDSIIYSLNSQLSAINGAVAQILTNVTISNSDQPGGTQTSEDISYLFDIESYDSIIVTQQVSI